MIATFLVSSGAIVARVSALRSGRRGSFRKPKLVGSSDAGEFCVSLPCRVGNLLRSFSFNIHSSMASPNDDLNSWFKRNFTGCAHRLSNRFALLTPLSRRYGRKPPDPKWPNGAKIAVNFVLNHVRSTLGQARSAELTAVWHRKKVRSAASQTGTRARRRTSRSSAQLA